MSRIPLLRIAGLSQFFQVSQVSGGTHLARSLGFGLVVAFVLAVTLPASAGPWAVGAGHFYAKLSASYLEADRLATPDGTEVDIPTFTREDVGLYFLYGLSDRWTLEIDAPVYRRSDVEGFTSSTGVGDLRLGLQAQLGVSGAWHWAARAIVQAPTGDENGGQGLLPTGTGEWEGELWISTGRSFRQGRGYGFIELGHQSRGGGLTDGLVYRTQLGYRPTPKLLLAVNVWGVKPYDEVGSGGIGSVTGLGDGVQYLAYGPSLILEFRDGWAMQFEVDGAEQIRNFASGPTVRLGVSLRL